jgi:hypothetical protein
MLCMAGDIAHGWTIRMRKGGTMAARQAEPCAVCGEDTAAGSPLFSDRGVSTQGETRQYLCSLCAAELRPSREVHSDEERERRRRRLESAALVFGPATRQ